MLKNQFDGLHNTLNHDGRFLREFYNKLCLCASRPNHYRIITVEEVSAAILFVKRKIKIAGLNGIYIESFIFAGDKIMCI